MAKKKTTFSFAEMQKTMNVISKKTSILIDTNIKERSYINTDIYMLNALLSKSIYGGVSDNRMTVFAGPEAVGKSFICYNIAKNAQKLGKNVIYIDTEYSIELSELQEFGVDVSPEKFMLIRSNKVEDIKFMMSQFLNTLKQEKMAGNDIAETVVFLDSIGQLASVKEVEDAIDGKNKTDMSRAKAIKSLFRIINADLGYLNIPLICTNHTYKTMDLFPQDVQGGGKGVDYSASSIVFLSKAQLKTGKEDDLDLNSSGILVTAKAKKNRIAKPKKIKFEINHSSGINPFKGLEYFCTPENFNTVGIAKVKKVIDKKTKKIEYIEGGTKWYVKHLDKSFYEKQLYTSKIFTKEVLDALEPIIYNYFSYASQEEIDKLMNDVIDENSFENDSDFDIDNDSDNTLFD